MNPDLMLRLEQVLHHSKRYYQRLCAWCDEPESAGCDHTNELLRQARRRRETLQQHPLTAWDPSRGPWFPAVVGEVGLAWPEGSQFSWGPRVA